MDGNQVNRHNRTCRVDLELDLESVKKKIGMVNMLTTWKIFKRIEKKEVENDFEERRVETNGNVSKADIFRKFVISHRISALPS